MQPFAHALSVINGFVISSPSLSSSSSSSPSRMFDSLLANPLISRGLDALPSFESNRTRLKRRAKYAESVARWVHVRAPRDEDAKYEYLARWTIGGDVANGVYVVNDTVPFSEVEGAYELHVRVMKEKLMRCKRYSLATKGPAPPPPPSKKAVDVVPENDYVRLDSGSEDEDEDDDADSVSTSGGID